MMISLPDIRNSSELVVRGFVTQFHVGEDVRFTEESVGIKSEPQVGPVAWWGDR